MFKKEYPIYFKSTIILFGIILIVYVLSTLQDVLIPVAFSVIIAILLNPLVNKLKRYKLSNALAIGIVLLVSIIAFGGLIYFLSSQITGFADNFPVLKSKLVSILQDLQQWLLHKYGIAINKQVQLLDEALKSSKALIGSTLGTALGTVSIIFLLPVYTFMILYYKSLILNFLYEIFANKNAGQVQDILSETKSAIQSYMVGLLLEALIVAILNSTALFIFDVKYAILIGVLGALLNMIPYLGGIIAIALPLLIATVTKDGYSTQLGILISYLVIQFIDNNFIVPKVVSSKVQINALFSIIIVLLGGNLWGVPGMFLSIPFVAILKIIFDRIDGLKPWGKLLGDDVPTRHLGQLLRKKINKKL